MPNHITNKLELLGSPEHIDQMIEKFGTYHKAELYTIDDGLVVLKSRAGTFDIRWLNLETGQYTNRDKTIVGYGVPEGFEIELRDSFFAFPECSKVIPPPDDPAYNDLPSQREAENSPNWWYKWNIKHWGTKWGGYSYKRLGITRFVFETAWSAPHPVIAEMSRQCPNVHIIHTWADEDTGSNCGKNFYNDGVLSLPLTPENQSLEAYEIAFELNPELKDNYVLAGGSYRYHETE
jgi:hypothetical protein